MIKSGKRRAVVFILEILVLLLFVGALFLYGQVDKKLEKIERPEPEVFEEERVQINTEAPKMTGYTTYALFGVDSRKNNEALAGENTDTMIIASINNDTKEVRLVSVYRDTLLNIGDGTYSKANAAYMLGGPEKAISMLNTNLDLHITDYATVDFSVLTEIVDYFGGLDIPLSYAEIEHMNNYCVETAKETGKTYTPVEKPAQEPEDLEAIVGTYHLNGVQVTSYCRIRYTASMDMGRTERQRRVIEMLVKKAIGSGMTGIFNLMDTVFPMVETSLDKKEILKMVPTLIGYSMGGTTGFPNNYKFADINGQSYIVPTTLEDNVVELHKFLYGENVAYTPSSDVISRSMGILETADQAIEDISAIVTTPEEEIWTDPNVPDNSYGTGYENNYGTVTDPNAGTVTTPNTGTVTTPNTGTVTTPNVGVTDPNAGIVTDPNVGVTDPNAGIVTDPNAGAVTDPNAGAVTDPNAGAVTDPNAGAVTDPNTGAVADPNVGVSYDTGVVADPGTEVAYDTATAAESETTM